MSDRHTDKLMVQYTIENNLYKNGTFILKRNRENHVSTNKFQIEGQANENLEV